MMCTKLHGNNRLSRMRCAIVTALKVIPLRAVGPPRVLPHRHQLLVCAPGPLDEQTGNRDSHAGDPLRWAGAPST